MSKSKLPYAGSHLKFLALAFFVIFLTGCDADLFYKKVTSVFTKEKNDIVYDAIAVWQNKGQGDWEIAYSLYSQKSGNWFYLQNSQIYYQGQANLIAKVAGDDQDPDIDSNGRQALAVWSNSGGEGNDGADIYYSFWLGNSWQSPTRLFALPGDDLDPTVYWQDSDNALVVWVNRQAAEKVLYFSEYQQGNWSQPAKIALPGRVEAIAAPQLGYLTVPQSRYLLVFTATVNGQSKAYLGIYSRQQGWQVSAVDGQTVAAVVDESIPSPYQSSVAMHIASRQAIVAWPAQDGNLWYAAVDLANQSFTAQKLAAGVNPYLQFGFGDFTADTILWQQADKIINLTPVKPGGYQQVVSSSEPQQTRLAASYLLYYDDRAMVAVWHTDQENPSEIYFSTVDLASQNWSSPSPIDQDLFPGEDRNPAITPLHVRLDGDKLKEVQEKGIAEDEWCGDKILQAGEECEIGIACKDKSKECDFDVLARHLGPVGVFFGECECIPPEDFPPQGGDQDSGDDDWDWGDIDQSDNSLGGAACGFNKVLVLEDNDSKLSLKFLPDTNPSNGTISFGQQTPMQIVFQKEFSTEMRLFPLSDPPHPTHLVKLKISRGQGDMIKKWPAVQAVEMRGYQQMENGGLFQLCVGTFEKGTAPVEGGFVPAPAAAGSDQQVPELPGQ